MSLPPFTSKLLTEQGEVSLPWKKFILALQPINVTASMEYLQSQISGLTVDVNTLETDLNLAESAITILQGKVATLEAKAITMQAQLNTLWNFMPQTGHARYHGYRPTVTVT